MIDLTNRQDIDFLKLDEHMFNVYSFALILNIAITMEYYIRHLLGFTEITLIYYTSDYLAAAAFTFVTYVITVEGIKQINHLKLDA